MPDAPPPIHPIEAESYRIIEARVDLSPWPPSERAVVARVVHAAADVEYASTLRFTQGAAESGVDALRSGAPVIVDVEMVAAATRRSDPQCLLAEGRAERDASGEPELTISAAAMRVAARRWPTGAIVVIGNAPTALFEVLRLIEAGAFAPSLIIGLPVGFVGAAESKEALRASGWPSISNVGERGGSAVAAAALNALARLAAARPPVAAAAASPHRTDGQVVV
jgi:precorrin-8X/cobalt-precorrin-8 methylmutase